MLRLAVGIPLLVSQAITHRRTAIVDDCAHDVPLTRLPSTVHSGAVDRDDVLRAVAARLDVPMTVLGIIFLLVVLAETLASSPAMERALTVVGSLLWAIFLGEFLLRLWIAPSRAQFLRRHWWQVVFLILPVFRFLRLISVLRVARAGRVVSSAVRSTRSARRVLSGRIAWLGAVTAIIILTSSELLYGFGSYGTYGSALHAATLCTVTGEPLGKGAALPDMIEVVLSVYSVAVFAALAGSLGAYFLQAHEVSSTQGH